MSSLQGKIALVTGASRGAGRGIALELGRAGATVYVTGRSVAGEATSNKWPGTIDETAAQVTASGGRGIAVRVDHTKEEEVRALIQRIREEQGRLDILVNNVWGGNELTIRNKPLWELPLNHWDNMFEAGVRAQLVTNYFAIPLMRENVGNDSGDAVATGNATASADAVSNGLIVHTTFWDDYKYTGHFYYDLAKNALIRMAQNLSLDLKPDRITTLALTPGWMRTEVVLADFNTDEAHWTDQEALAPTESPHYIGRAIAALAADPNVFDKTGRILRVGDLAREYGFTDVDGRQPPAFTLPE